MRKIPHILAMHLLISATVFGKTAPDLKQLPNNEIAFVENKGQIRGYDGQAHPEIKYTYSDGKICVFLTETGLIYQFTKTHYPKEYIQLMNGQPKDAMAAAEQAKKVRTETFRMDMTLTGASKAVRITAGGRSNDYLNYYNTGVMNVHSYHKITYHDIYPGIDWIIYTSADGLKYDFAVTPGSNPALIKMAFKYQEDISLNEEGGFTLKCAMGSVSEKTPICFQKGQPVKTHFLLQDNTISFLPDSYDKNETLLIDPAITWATYYGGTGADIVTSCATDHSGNVYISGYTDSNSDIAIGGYQNVYAGGGDPYLAKLNSSGVRQWATYYGVSGNNYAYCSTDASGNVYLCGSTGSSTNIAFQGHQNTMAGGSYDAFLAKFDTNGLRLWATYYGGTGFDFGTGCATDIAGNVYLTGYTTSNSGIFDSGHQSSNNHLGYDAFLVKFNSSGIRQWGTYYGGDGFYEWALSVCTDTLSNVYICGPTTSTINIASNGFQTLSGGNSDAFLVKFNTNGTRLWSTYYGGPDADVGYSCATDKSGNVYLVGTTESTVMIAFNGHQNTPGAYQDAFLVKFNAGGSRLWATYYGGANYDMGFSCSTDQMGNVYLAGAATSPGLAFNGYQDTISQMTDAFIAKFTGAGIRQWASYYGGQAPGMGTDHGKCCTADLSGNVYLGGYTESTTGMSFGGHQNTFGGSSDGFLVKFCNHPAQPLSISGNTNVCEGSFVTYSVSVDPEATGYSWILPSLWTGTSTTNIINASAGCSGTIMVVPYNMLCSGTANKKVIQVNPLPVITITSSHSLICAGETTTLNAMGGSIYLWDSGSPSSSIVVNPIVTTIYSVSAKDLNGCSNTSTITQNVNECLDLKELKLLTGPGFYMYPNPNSGELFIESSGPATIKIVNALGEIIMERQLTEGKNRIDLTSQSQGIYLLNHPSGSLKIVKE